MTIPLAILWPVVSFLVGVTTVFAAAWGMDAYHTWSYRRREMRELRERPKVPTDIYHINITRYPEDRIWYATAHGRNNLEIDHNSGEHPMDAIRYLILQYEEDH